MRKNRLGVAKRKLLLIVLVLAFAVGAGYGYWRTVQTDRLTAAQANSGYQSTAVRIGSIAVSINGSGTVKSEQSYDLGFPVSGTLGELNVDASQTVTRGERLAALSDEDVAALELAVKEAQTAVLSAQEKLDTLTNSSNSSLAQALVDQASAQQALAEAKTKLIKPGAGRCEKNVTETYYYEYLYAQKPVEEWEGYLEGGSGYGRDYILQKLTPLWKTRDLAYANWKYCESYTEQEVLNSQAALKTAQANLEAADKKVEKLKTSSGVDTTGLEIAQAELSNAQAQLTAAQEDLAGAVITSPIDGIVTEVNAEVGDSVRAVNVVADKDTVDPNSIISVTNLDSPYVEAIIDETDLQNLAVGCPATITFDALSGQSFTGSVTQVAPSLSDTSGVSMVAALTGGGPSVMMTNSAGASGIKALVVLDQTHSQSGKALPVGLSANVEITCSETQDALIAPAQGLYQPKDGSPYVYILTADGKAEKREVTIGLKTAALVEITSGLSEGDRVITSTVE